jgi:hypothetical protein
MKDYRSLIFNAIGLVFGLACMTVCLLGSAYFTGIARDCAVGFSFLAGMILGHFAFRTWEEVDRIRNPWKVW